MVSNVFKIKRGATELGAILTETEKVARYNELSDKNALSLRLLAEELVSMLPSVVKSFEGSFWIENEGLDYALRVQLCTEDMDVSMRDELINLSSSRKNAAVVGVTGKIRAVIDYMVLGGDEAAAVSLAGSYGFGADVDYQCLWSLREYRDGVAPEEQEQRDELEKSIIAKLADDVVVGVKGKRVSLIIKKSFEESQR